MDNIINLSKAELSKLIGRAIGEIQMIRLYIEEYEKLIRKEIDVNGQLFYIEKENKHSILINILTGIGVILIVLVYIFFNYISLSFILIYISISFFCQDTKVKRTQNKCT